MTAAAPASKAGVWRDLDQSELDRQYNSRGTVPDVSVYLRIYAQRTAEARAGVTCLQDLPYGNGPDDRLDVYPTRAADAPVLVFLHGGDWRGLSRHDSGFAAPAYGQAGATLVVPDFTLVPATTLPAMGAQVRRALHWVWQNIARFGGDPQRIHIAGHSSGANLVGQLLMTDWQNDFNAPTRLVRSATFMSGLGDLEPVRLSFRNQRLGLTPEVVDEASLLRAGARTGHLAACPLMVAVGANETPDYLRQSREVAAFWRQRGHPATLMELAGRHHFDAVLEWADPASALFQAQCAQMGLE